MFSVCLSTSDRSPDEHAYGIHIQRLPLHVYLCNDLGDVFVKNIYGEPIVNGGDYLYRLTTAKQLHAA